MLKRRQLLLGGSALAAWSMALLARRQVVSTPRPPQPQPSFSGPQGFFVPLRGDVRIVVISDLNSQYGSTDYEPEVRRAIALIPAWQPDLVLCGGDMVAGQSTALSDDRVRAMWMGFDRAIGAPLRRANLPLGFTLGNHDGSGVRSATGAYRFERDRKLAQAYWNKPDHTPRLQFADRAQFPFYYTFTQNNIFYLVWDASTARIDPQQLAWVEKSLASAAAQKARLRIAIGHLPLYPVAVGRNKPGEFLDRADALRSLLEKYRVHTYISGHNHAYFPGHQGELQLLQTGALGSGPRQLLNSNLPPFKTLTVIDISVDDAMTRYTTYNMTTGKVVDEQTLPRLIVGPYGSQLRRDVEPSALNSEERDRWAKVR
jgi:hypothetical protein